MAESRLKNGDISCFSEVSEEVSGKYYWIVQFPRRLKEGNTSLHEFKTSKLLNELMSVRTQLKVSNDHDNSVHASDFAKAVRSLILVHIVEK